MDKSEKYFHGLGSSLDTVVGVVSVVTLMVWLFVCLAWPKGSINIHVWRFGTYGVRSQGSQGGNPEVFRSKSKVGLG